MDSSILEKMPTRAKDAYTLAEAALVLGAARGKVDELAVALEHNLTLWVAIRTLVSAPGNVLPATIRENLIRLSGFVLDTTCHAGVGMSENQLNTLININLQIAAGLRGQAVA